LKMGAAVATLRRWSLESPMRPGHLALAAVLLAGAVLRLAWVRDMEYKADEAYMFERTRHVGVTEGWPWLGMTSGVALRNPGMSVWVFLVPGKLFGGDKDPTVLARVPQVLSLAALVGLVAFAGRRVRPGEREAWLWAAALAAVNPVGVVLERKIWAQSVLPLFSLLLLLGWWHRRSRGGAFAWGLVGACLGQIHLSGFFYAGGFALWTALFDRRGPRWGSWLAGSAVGALPMLPWVVYLLNGPAGEVPTGRSWVNCFTFLFWWWWATDVLGLGISDPLVVHFREYLTYPVIGGRPTCLMGLAYALALGAGAAIYLRALPTAWREPRSWLDYWTGRSSPAGLAEGAALWGFGILLTASACFVLWHYLLVAFPFPFVWLARLALVGGERRRGGRALLAVLCLAQLLLTAGFLDYIHVNQGAVGGWYGTAYGAQVRE
jgi:hypothetical protein